MASPVPNIAEQLRDVRVGVRPELDVSRHVFGGEPAYVVRDPVSFQSHRLSAEDYQVFTSINDRQTLGVVCAGLIGSGVLEEDQEEEFYRFVLSLTQRGLLNLPLSDGGRLYKRFQQRQQAKRKSRLMSALFLRVPLVQPDRFLDRTIDLVKPMFTWTALAVWSVGLVASLVVVASRWHEVASPLASILAVGNIPVLWTLLVVLKVIHELGHAYACKRFGGDVPEMGAFFILFTPCAYVDASSSWGFTSRWQRVVVALAGMYFESIAAMFALAVWVFTPPGTLHDAAHYAVVLSTVVTIGFNANPLMRYDGYYILSDAVGMPNLRSEATQHIHDLAARILYGVRKERHGATPLKDIGLTLFGVASTIYKVGVVFGISLVIAHKLPLVGIGMAAMYVLQAVKGNFLSLLNFLRFSDQLEGRRRRAVGVTAALAFGTLLLVGAVPMPGGVETLAVVTRREEVTVRAETPGFLRDVLVEDGDSVSPDDVLCRLENLDIEADAQRLEAKTEALEVQWQRVLFEDRQKASRFETQLSQIKEDRRVAQQQRDALSVRSDRAGVVTSVEAERVGRFVQRGEPVAVIGAGPWTLKALLTAEQIIDAGLRPGEEVRFRLIGRPGETHTGRVVRVASQGLKKVEHAELTHLAGGGIAVNPESSESAQTRCLRSPSNWKTTQPTGCEPAARPRCVSSASRPRSSRTSTAAGCSSLMTSAP